jgi:hypothetical protein
MALFLELTFTDGRPVRVNMDLVTRFFGDMGNTVIYFDSEETVIVTESPQIIDQRWRAQRNQ